MGVPTGSPYQGSKMVKGQFLDPPPLTILDPRGIPCCAPSLVESGNWSSFSNWFKNDEDLNLDFFSNWISHFPPACGI